MAYKFKTGDRVQIPNDKNCRNRSHWMSAMDKFIGETVTIKGSRTNGKTYYIEELPGYWFYETDFRGTDTDEYIYKE